MSHPLTRCRFAMMTIVALLCLAVIRVEAQWNHDGAVLHTTDNVGIGTNAPAVKLHVAGTPGTISLQHSTQPKSDNAVAGIVRFTDNVGAEYGWFGDGSSTGNFMTLYAGSTHGLSMYSGGTNVIHALPSGLIGIGTASPSNKLHVIGNVRVEGDVSFTGTLTGGSIAAKYQDLAEWVPATDDLTPGTVVVLENTRCNTVTASGKSYDTTVAGVVSAQPGITLGDRDDGMEMIATTGRVRVKVDATHIPIEVGDLLVTSDKPGRAMKSVPVDLSGVVIHRPGTILGKALEPLHTGEGDILVLLSLQ